MTWASATRATPGTAPATRRRAGLASGTGRPVGRSISVSSRSQPSTAASAKAYRRRASCRSARNTIHAHVPSIRTRVTCTPSRAGRSDVPDSRTSDAAELMTPSASPSLRYGPRP